MLGKPLAQKALSATPSFRSLIHTSRIVSKPLSLEIHTAVNEPRQHDVAILPLPQITNPPPSNLSQLPTINIARNLMLGMVFSSSLLFNPGMAVLKAIANAKSPLLNPDKNIVLGSIMRHVVYKHFCAGSDKPEVQQTIGSIKDIGFAGVILTNGKEIVFDKSASSSGIASTTDDAALHRNVGMWLNDNMKTLDMIGEGDYLGLKLTGCGPEVAALLSSRGQLPDCLSAAFASLCRRALAQGSRIMIDAEQWKLQPTIAAWSLDLMRRHNTHGDALILTTIQSYLKSAPATLTDHLAAAQKEGWTLGVKLVRGAYIASEDRALIHDRKTDTDACFDGIAKDLLEKSWSGFSKSDFPKVRLFVASHNAESCQKAAAVARKLALAGEQVNVLGYGQLQGMADEVSCGLLQSQSQQQGRAADGELAARQLAAAPKAYKYLTWGSVQECMQYLVRRATENRGAADRIQEGLTLYRAEMWRRIMRRSA